MPPPDGTLGGGGDGGACGGSAGVGASGGSDGDGSGCSALHVASMTQPVPSKLTHARSRPRKRRVVAAATGKGPLDADVSWATARGAAAIHPARVWAVGCDVALESALVADVLRALVDEVVIRHAALVASVAGRRLASPLHHAAATKLESLVRRVLLISILSRPSRCAKVDTARSNPAAQAARLAAAAAARAARRRAGPS